MKIRLSALLCASLFAQAQAQPPAEQAQTKQTKVEQTKLQQTKLQQTKVQKAKVQQTNDLQTPVPLAQTQQATLQPPPGQQASGQPPPGQQATDPQATASREFNALLDEHWQRAEQEQVFFRTDTDAYRPNGRLAEVDEEARARRQAFNDYLLTRLEQIDGSQLQGQEAMSYQLFRYEREAERESYEYPNHLFPFTSLTGYHSYFAEAPAKMAFNTVEDYQRYLVSLADFPRYNSEHIELLEEAIARGYTHYCGAMVGYENTIGKEFVERPRDSALYAPFAIMPATIPAPMQAELRKQGEALIAGKVVPAYRALYDFFVQRYMPACRSEAGISSVEGGADYYQHLLRFFTTTDLSPIEIHELGLSETRRIRAEMEAIIQQLGFEGSFSEFLKFLRTDPRFYATDPQDLLEKTALIAKNMDGRMPSLFGRLAQNTYAVRPVEGRGAYYVPGATDGSAPGIYYISISDPATKPLYNLEALTLHEAVPGHHHQTALAMELGLPEFRKTAYHAAFSEGWGLYSERLGLEAGFYTDPYSNFGRLTYEMWRANRLVIDTGIHAFGWSRQQAIDYLLANSALTRPEVVDEIDRYITWPGQATAYKIGELKIRALRARAEDALGPNFNIRDFNDMVVGNGSIPIAVLEEVAAAWLAEQLQ